MVAKANCYGLGEKLCKYLKDEVDYFAVSSGYEFFNIYKILNKPILILDPIYDEKLLKKLILNKAQLTVSNINSLNKIIKVSSELNIKIKIHIAINTGMNRFGFSSIEELDELLKNIKKSQNIDVLGVFSHFFDGKCEKTSQKQIKKFIIYSNLLDNFLNIKTLKHISASDGLFYNNFGDMVRIGFSIYDNLVFDTLTLKTKILEFKKLKVGESAGYNSFFIAKEDTTLAVIAIGYGDGILRNIANKGYCLINGKLAKIVAICMDTMIVDVSKINCKINDDVIIIGKSGKFKISICDIAGWCDTIGYEIIVRLSNRIKRIYLGDNKCRL